MTHFQEHKVIAHDHLTSNALDNLIAGLDDRDEADFSRIDEIHDMGFLNHEARLQATEAFVKKLAARYEHQARGRAAELDAAVNMIRPAESTEQAA